MPIVTIAIPFYNAESFLEKAIVSVLSQSYDDFVLLLINDGSTDASLDIANKYSYDQRVQIISDGKNRNLGNRLNEIPYLTETKFLARMDADDIMHPLRIEKQLDILNKNPEIDVLGTNAYSIDENDFVIGLRMEVTEEKLVDVQTFTHPTIIAKREWFINNPYDVQAVRIEDAELWLATNTKYIFKATTEPLLFYREFGVNYYKKYFKGFPGVFYMLRKHNYSKKYLLFSIKYFISSFIYFAFNLFGKESVLVKRRNKIQLEKNKYTSYI